MTHTHEFGLSRVRANIFVGTLRNLREKPISVVDVGFCCGYALEQMNAEFDDVGLTGCDAVLSDEGLARLGQIDVPFIHGSLNDKLPFEARDFSWVFCSHTLEHANDTFHAAKELCRIADRGIFLVVPLESDAKYNEYIRTFTPEQLLGPGMHRMHTTNPTEWLLFFYDSGFVPVRLVLDLSHSDLVVVLMRESCLSYGGRV